MDLQQRLKAVIQKDKNGNQQYLINVIKSDFYYLISNYFEVDFDDIEIEIMCENEKYAIAISCLGERMKSVKILPS